MKRGVKGTSEILNGKDEGRGIKSSLYGFTQPRKVVREGRKRSINDVSREIKTISGIVSRWSLSKPVDYLKRTRKDVILSNLHREIENSKKKCEKIKESAEYKEVERLEEQLKQIDGDLETLEENRLVLIQESESAANLLTRITLDLESSMTSFYVNQTLETEESIKMSKSLLNKQRMQLLQRKKLLALTNGEFTRLSLQRETEELSKQTMQTMEELKKRKATDEANYTRLREYRDELKKILENELNTEFQDVTVPMRKLIEYVKKKDPIILLRDFERRQH